MKWEEDELEAIEKSFCQEILHSAVPRKAQVERAKKKFPVLAGRSFEKIRSKVVYISKNRKKKYCIEESE